MLSQNLWAPEMRPIPKNNRRSRRYRSPDTSYVRETMRDVSAGRFERAYALLHKMVLTDSEQEADMLERRAKALLMRIPLKDYAKKFQKESSESAGTPYGLENNSSTEELNIDL